MKDQGHMTAYIRIGDGHARILIFDEATRKHMANQSLVHHGHFMNHASNSGAH